MVASGRPTRLSSNHRTIRPGNLNILRDPSFYVYPSGVFGRFRVHSLAAIAGPLTCLMTDMSSYAGSDACSIVYEGWGWEGQKGISVGFRGELRKFGQLFPSIGSKQEVPLSPTLSLTAIESMRLTEELSFRRRIPTLRLEIRSFPTGYRTPLFPVDSKPFTRYWTTTKHHK